jgi:hypothetical protein
MVQLSQRYVNRDNTLKNIYGVDCDGCSGLGFRRTSRFGDSNPLYSYHVAIIYVDRCGRAISEV